MGQVRRYLVLIDAQTSQIFDKFYDYMQYSTKNFVMIDSQAFIIDSYLNVSDLIDELINLSYTTEIFACEITGEITWRNPVGGFNKLNNFFNK